MTDVELAYIAGLIDGEGNISIIQHMQQSSASGKRYRPETLGRKYKKHRRNVLVVGLGMTDAIIPVWLWMNFGGNVYEAQPNEPNRKPVYKWNVRSTKALRLLEQVHPYLKLKRAQAEIGMEFQRKRVSCKPLTLAQRQADDALRKACNKLNQRGVPLEIEKENSI